ncbi:MAG TPA: hypothetical protein VKF60_17360 [Myxococcota bacterium]|nr:hypothetical protein [Myxococcota bacterium]
MIANLAGSLAQVTRAGIVERSVASFAAADAEPGKRLAEAIRARRGPS